MRHRPHTWKIKHRYDPAAGEYRWFVWLPHNAEAHGQTFATWNEAAWFLWEVYRLQKARKHALAAGTGGWPARPPQEPLQVRYSEAWPPASGQPIRFFPFPAGH